ncbi:MAG: DUF2189 domain-containing protein [Thiohalocapsa sp.]
MTTNADDHSTRSQSPAQGVGDPRILEVDSTAAVDWLKAGWRTFIAAPGVSLLFGVLFALVCAGAVTLTIRNPGFTTAFITGLLLIGPFLACGLYVAARQHASGERVRIGASLALLWDRRTNLSLFAVFLALVMAAWVRFSSLLFAFQMDAFGPTAYNWENFLAGRLDPAILGFFLVIGALLAVVVFVTSAVAIPMIVDRDAGPIPAISASYRAVKQNWQPMALWAAMIVALTGIGILTWFVGMVVLFPLLGYATWYSYRALLD